MKSTSLSTKLIMVFVFLAVAAYFGVQGYNYFVKPETTTLVYAYRTEESISANGYVVRDEAVRLRTVEEVRIALETSGFAVRGTVESPIKGPEGNVEYLIYAVFAPDSVLNPDEVW